LATAGLSPNELLQAIQRVRLKKEDDIPEGWLTLKEWAELWEKSKTAAEVLLRKGVSAGLIEVQKFNRYAGNELRVIKHYRQATATNRGSPSRT
jgi:hypothetical protein